MSILIIILSTLLLREIIKRKEIKKDIREISIELEKLLESDELERVLYNTSSSEVKKLLVVINILLFNKFNERILRLEKEKHISRTLTNMAHDLRTPLTITQGYIEELVINGKGIKDKQTLDKLQTKIKEVIKLVNKFFILSKLESGDERIEISTISLTKIVKENILSHYNILNREEFKVNINLPKENIYISGNEEALNRILDNLVGNIIKYGSYGKYIGISLKEVGESINLELSDKGQGIKENEIDRIFDRCYKAKVLSDNYTEGSGIGLRITKILVEAMSGTIEVESKAYDETKFTIRFVR